MMKIDLDNILNTSTEPEERKKYDIKLPEFDVVVPTETENISLAKLKKGKMHEEKYVDELLGQGTTVELKCEYYDTGWHSGNMCLEVWNDSTSKGYQGESGITATRAENVVYRMISSKENWQKKLEDSVEFEFDMVTYSFKRWVLKAYLTLLVHWKTNDQKDDKDNKEDKLDKIRYIRGGDGKRAISMLVPLNIAVMTDKDLNARFKKDFSKLRKTYGEQVYTGSFWDKEFHNYAVPKIIKGVSKLVHTEHERK